MKNELEDIRNILKLKSVSDAWKLKAIGEIVAETEPKEDFSEIVVEKAPQPKREVAKRKHEGPYRTREKGISKEEVEIMHEAFEKYGDTADVREALCKQLGRSYSSISNMAHRYKHGKYFKRFKIRPTSKKGKAIPVPNSYKKVTQTEVDTIMKEKFINGNSIGAIAKLLGRTKGSVNGVIWQVQHGKRKTSVNWKPAEKVKAELVDVGDDGSTKIPRKFKMFG